MADPHGHTPASAASAQGAHDDHDDHGAPPEEDVLRTPGWLPFIGLALLLLGSVGVYRMMSTSAAAAASADGGAEAGAQSDGGTAPGH